MSRRPKNDDLASTLVKPHGEMPGIGPSLRRHQQNASRATGAIWILLLIVNRPVHGRIRVHGYIHLNLSN